MYVPPHFDEARTEVLHDLIRRHPFGTLVTHGAGGLDANHIPFELLPGQGALGTLSAHVARANPLWREVADGDEVLVVFRAGDAYVSPNWYPSKHETHQQVPTWNYMVAHAHGRISIRDDERYVRGMVARLTRSHEAAQPVPWKMGDSAGVHRRPAAKDRRPRDRDHPPERQVQAQPEQGTARPAQCGRDPGGAGRARGRQRDAGPCRRQARPGLSTRPEINVNFGKHKRRCGLPMRGKAASAPQCEHCKHEPTQQRAGYGSQKHIYFWVST